MVHALDSLRTMHFRVCASLIKRHFKGSTRAVRVWCPRPLPESNPGLLCLLSIKYLCLTQQNCANDLFLFWSFCLQPKCVNRRMSVHVVLTSGSTLLKNSSSVGTLTTLTSAVQSYGFSQITNHGWLLIWRLCWTRRWRRSFQGTMRGYEHSDSSITTPGGIKGPANKICLKPHIFEKALEKDVFTRSRI